MYYFKVISRAALSVSHVNFECKRPKQNQQHVVGGPCSAGICDT